MAEDTYGVLSVFRQTALGHANTWGFA